MCPVSLLLLLPSSWRCDELLRGRSQSSLFYLCFYYRFLLWGYPACGLNFPYDTGAPPTDSGVLTFPITLECH